MKPGPSSELTQALAIAAEQDRAWSDVERDGQTHAVVEYARGAEAIGNLVAWSRADGGLAPLAPHPAANAEALVMFQLGSMAIASSTDAAWDGLVAGGYLGNRLVREGRTLLEAEVGMSLLERAVARLVALGDPPDSIELPEHRELVRILAAEAMWAHSLAPAAEGLVGRATARATQTFWIAALDGASPTEPAAVTVARVRRAIASADPFAYTVTRYAPAVIERMVRRFDARFRELR